MAEKKSSILKNTIVIFLVTLVSVALLAIVNQVTLEPIEKAQIAAEAASLSDAYADAKDFAQIDGKEAMLEKSTELLESADIQKCTINNVLAAQDASGNLIGYAISVTSQNGYGADLQIAVGISKDGTLAGFSVISNNETPGFGANCTNPEFTSQFKGKSAEGMLTFTKDGNASESEIDAISGATITTNAVTEAVNGAIVFYQENFGGGVKKAETVAVDNAEEVADGYKITATSKKGFAGDITVAVVIGKDATVKSFEIVSSNETEGYGAKANEPDYAKQFAGLKADKITSVPSGANKDNNEIDAIAGATFTTKAVSSAVNEAIKYYQENYGDGLSESFSAEDDAAEEADASSSASPVAGKISISVNVKGE